MALTLSACSGAPDVVAEGTENAGPIAMASAPDHAAAPAAPDVTEVRVSGTVESVDPGTASSERAAVAGADVCVVTTTARTCTTTNDSGEYAFRVAKSDEVAMLRVEHAGYQPTVTRVALRADVSDALALVPSRVAIGESGALVIRGFVTAYFMLMPLPGLSVDAVTDSNHSELTTDAAGVAFLASPAAGATQFFGSANVLTCGTWNGSHADLGAPAVSVEQGAVTEVDVVCGSDANEF
jgi:hypothetical protein